jgi:hypothetical protein
MSPTASHLAVILQYWASWCQNSLLGRQPSEAEVLGIELHLDFLVGSSGFPNPGGGKFLHHHKLLVDPANGRHLDEKGD